MKINISSGHNPDGKVACGAVGLIKESTEARKVKDLLIPKLKTQGHTVYDCTVNDGTSQNDVLTKIVKKCNANTVDLDISIHFNAGANDSTGNGITTGTECLVYKTGTKAGDYAYKICESISKLGYRNRGVKVRTDLYFLNNTKAEAVLVECCFVDDADDVKLYNAEKMAQAIAEAIGYAEGFKEDLEVVEESKIIVNGKEISVRRILKDGTNYIAIRDVASALGYEIGNQGNVAVLDKK